MAVAAPVLTTVVAPAMSANDVPPFVLRCHCAVIGRLPLTVAVNVAVSPTHTVRAAGCAVIPANSGTPVTVTDALPVPGGISAVTMRCPWVVSPGVTTTS